MSSDQPKETKLRPDVYSVVSRWQRASVWENKTRLNQQRMINTPMFKSFHALFQFCFHASFNTVRFELFWRKNRFKGKILKSILKLEAQTSSSANCSKKCWNVLEYMWMIQTACTSLWKTFRFRSLKWFVYDKKDQQIHWKKNIQHSLKW